MAEAFFNPIAAEAMGEIGVPMDGQERKIFTQHRVKEFERVITMGCGVGAEACPQSSFSPTIGA